MLCYGTFHRSSVFFKFFFCWPVKFLFSFYRHWVVLTEVSVCLNFLVCNVLPLLTFAWLIVLCLLLSRCFIDIFF